MMDDALSRLRLDYTPVMLRYLTQQDESGLQAAYDLGRQAMSESIGILALIRVHNEVLIGVLHTASSAREAQKLVQAASTLLIDFVAAFELPHRAFLESQGERAVSGETT
jgi:hypothetical protein